MFSGFNDRQSTLRKIPKFPIHWSVRKESILSGIIFPFRWEEAPLYFVFKKDSKKAVNHRQMADHLLTNLQNQN